MRGLVGGIEGRKLNHEKLMRDYVGNVERMCREGGGEGGG